MPTNKIRKEVSLDDNTIVLLKIQAENEGRNLKNYMEYLLREKANSFKLTDEYKAMMDDMLLKHDKGEMAYMDETEFRKRTSR